MRAVLVTGASRGIGHAAAEAFAKEGCRVFLNYRADAQGAEEAAAALRRAGADAHAVCADVADPAAVENMARETGPVDVLVSNAGVSWRGLLSDMRETDWRRVLDVNLGGLFHCVRAYAPEMVRRKAGRIIAVSSMWGVTGGSCEAAYSAAKAGVIGLVRALAKELGPSGICVNCVAPGVIDTAMNAALTPNDRAALCEETPLGRLGSTEEVARVISFLAGPGGDFITGQVISPNGGIVI